MRNRSRRCCYLIRQSSAFFITLSHPGRWQSFTEPVSWWFLLRLVIVGGEQSILHAIWWMERSPSNSPRSWWWWSADNLVRIAWRGVDNLYFCMSLHRDDGQSTKNGKALLIVTKPPHRPLSQSQMSMIRWHGTGHNWPIRDVLQAPTNSCLNDLLLTTLLTKKTKSHTKVFSFHWCWVYM